MVSGRRTLNILRHLRLIKLNIYASPPRVVSTVIEAAGSVITKFCIKAQWNTYDIPYSLISCRILETIMVIHRPVGRLPLLILCT